MRKGGWTAAAAVAVVALAGCGTAEVRQGSSKAAEKDKPTLGYSCDGREGETGVDPFGGQPIVCTTVPNKRATALETRWAVDESRLTATSFDVDKALVDAVRSAERLVTGRSSAGTSIPALRPACETLEKTARRAGDTRRQAAAAFCMSEVDSISAARPATSVNPGILARLRDVL